MAIGLQTLDIADSFELLDLAEEVRRSGVPWLLTRGDQEFALVTPIAPGQPSRAPTLVSGDKRDTLLNIIGIGESAEPTDVANFELEYLATAYVPEVK